MPSKKAHVSFNSGNNERFTPPEYIEAVKEVLGGIDLDPASSPLANCIIGATTYYSKEDDGLSKEWCARTLFMNPPYENKLIKQFTAKLTAHIAAGYVAEAIVLVNNATETSWFNELITEAAAIVFTRGRIHFIDNLFTRLSTPLQGQAFIYFGDKADKFLIVFSKFGWGAYILKKRHLSTLGNFL